MRACPALPRPALGANRTETRAPLIFIFMFSFELINISRVGEEICSGGSVSSSRAVAVGVAAVEVEAVEAAAAEEAVAAAAVEIAIVGLGVASVEVAAVCTRSCWSWSGLSLVRAQVLPQK